MRERILVIAMRMLEEGAVADLSMRKLAAELGLAPTAIYWHVGNRRDLLNQVVDRLIAEMGSPEPSGATPLERMAAIARWIRQQVRARPQLIGLAHEQGRSGEVFFPAQSALATELSGAGVKGAKAALAVRAIAFYAGGFILLEHSLEERTEPPPDRPTSEELWAAHATGIPPGLAGRLAGPVDFDELFDFSLDALLRAVLPAQVPSTG
jgi:AcrR family transcriptional regulator